jgi:hypothetical protein
MLQKEIEKLGGQALVRGILPRKRARVSGAAVVGFDTEYSSKTGELLCATFAAGEAEHYVEFPQGKRLTPAGLVRAVRALGVEAHEVLLVSYFSLAELQHLPVAKQAFGWREYGASFDCSFRVGDTVVTVFDLARFFDRSALSKVAEVFGLRKLAWKRESVSRADLRRRGFREYAINDAILAERIFCALRKEFLSRTVDIIVSATPARAASDTFRAGLDAPIVNEEQRARYVGLRAVWGGRAEVFARGRFPELHEYDLVSAYPQAVISFGEFPAADNWKECTTWRELERCKGGLARAQWTYPEGEHYPALPMVHGGRMMYFREGAECVSFDELREARAAGAKIRLIEAWGFRRGDSRLADFMRAVVEERQTATGARRVMLKLLANSLIGKLAQKSRRLDIEKLWRHCEKTGEDFGELVRMTAEELAVLGFDYGYSVGSCYAPEWNALVTGRVRATISRACRDFRAVYCATDAIWTTEQVPKMPEGFELKRSGPGIIARAKLARLGDHVVHHGIHGKRTGRELARRMLDEEEDVAEYTTRRPLRPREALSIGKPIGAWVEERRFACLAWDWKRKLLSDGTSVPWKDAREYDLTRREKDG